MAKAKPRTAAQRAASRANLAVARAARWHGGKAGLRKHVMQEKRAAREGRDNVNKRVGLEDVLGGKRAVNAHMVRTAPKTVVPQTKAKKPLNIGQRSVNWW